MAYTVTDEAVKQAINDAKDAIKNKVDKIKSKTEDVKTAVKNFQEKQVEQYDKSKQELNEAVEKISTSIEGYADKYKNNSLNIFRALKEQHEAVVVNLTQKVQDDHITKFQAFKQDIRTTIEQICDAAVQVALTAQEIAESTLSASVWTVQATTTVANNMVDSEIMVTDQLSTKGLAFVNTLTQMMIDVVDTENRGIDQLREDVNRWSKWPNLNRHVDNFIDFAFFFRSYTEAVLVIVFTVMCLVILRNLFDIFLDAVERKTAVNRLYRKIELDRADYDRELEELESEYDNDEGMSDPEIHLHED